jgi:hypothetical protein
MQRDSDEKKEKHESSIRSNCDSASNINVLIFALAKQELPRTCTDRGTQSNFNEQLARHPSPNDINFDALSRTNVSN